MAGLPNLGAALLGQVLAVHAGIDFSALLRTRIFTPAGMHCAAVATRHQKAVPGWSAQGLPRQPWVMDGYAPAGGVIATMDEDMARLASALLERTAPGHASMTAVTGVVTKPGRQSGMFWVIEPIPAGGS